MRWLPPILSDPEKDGEAPTVEDTAYLRVPPNLDNLYLFVNEEEGSRLYLRRGSGSSFNMDLTGSNTRSIRFGSKLAEALDKDDEDTDDGGRLACVSASDYKGGRGLIVWMNQRMDEDQRASEETITLCGYLNFYVERTPITNSTHGELFKISLPSERIENLHEYVRVHPRLV